MITVDELKKLSQPPEIKKAYYRPLICNGDLSKADIFFVGTNPATPIYQNELDIDKYVELLLNYEEFINYYKETRIKKGKSEFSRTRIGMNSFLNWLSANTNSSIIETEVIPYPTEKLKLLWKESSYIIDRGKDVFYELAIKFRPKLLILHGKETVEQAINIFSNNGLLNEQNIILNQRIEQMEEQMPLVSFTYPNGKKGYIIACRHFMYYGSKGESYADFREKTLKLLNRI